MPSIKKVSLQFAYMATNVLARSGEQVTYSTRAEFQSDLLLASSLSLSPNRQRFPVLLFLTTN